MTAIVLAGGFGTRLQSLVSDVPKPMAPIIGRPFLECIFRYLLKNGITKVILSVGYKYQVIQNYFEGNYKGIEIQYVIEDQPLGTGGAIKKSLIGLKDDKVFIVNGDTFFNVDLLSLVKMYEENSSQLVLSLKTMRDFDRYGCVEVDKSGKVIEFSEKEYKAEGNINGGIYLIQKNIFDDYDLETTFSFEDFMQDHFKDLNAYGFVFSEYFIDIGIPEDYKRAQYEMQQYL